MFSKSLITYSLIDRTTTAGAVVVAVIEVVVEVVVLVEVLVLVEELVEVLVLVVEENVRSK
jgi:hypothetical protein